MFGIGVGARYKICRAFPAYLQIFDFAKIAQHATAGSGGGFMHHIYKGGTAGHEKS
jgi:hypothetical protein